MQHFDIKLDCADIGVIEGVLSVDYSIEKAGYYKGEIQIEKYEVKGYFPDDEGGQSLEVNLTELVSRELVDDLLAECLS